MVGNFEAFVGCLEYVESENKALYYALGGVGAFVIVAVLGVIIGYALLRHSRPHSSQRSSQPEGIN